MTKKSDEASALVRAAETIDGDLQRLEELSHSVEKLRLNTEKNIVRAARTLQAALEQQEQLARDLHLLGEAMVQMQQRQQAAVDRLSARSADIKDQATRLSEHTERFAALGVQAAQVTKMLEGLPTPGTSAQAVTEGETMDPAAMLTEVEARLTALTDEAKAIAASAEAADLSEVLREATALRQKIESARGRVTLIARTRAQRAN